MSVATWIVRQLLWISLLPWLTAFLWAIAEQLGGAKVLTDAAIATLLGGVVSVIANLMLPAPWTAYVVGHELTHALFAWLCGHRVKGLKFGAKGGHVVVSDANALTVLAPYFFPLYAVVWLAAVGAVAAVFPAVANWLLLPFGFGFFYAFHVTMTLKVVRFRQPDIVREGVAFSAVVIGLGNVSTMLVGLPTLLGRHNGTEGLALGWEKCGRLLDGLIRLSGW